MTTAMESLKQMIDVNTIIGDPVETPDGSVILTVSKVGFGFAAGGSEFQVQGQNGGGSSDEDGGSSVKHPFGGGSGGGVSITPIAFLVVNANGVKMIHLDESTHLFERILDFAPQAVDKIQSMVNNSKNKEDPANGQNNNSQPRQQNQQNHQQNNYQQQTQNNQHYEEPPI